MPPQKRNEFLEASDSEDDVPNYDSDDDLKKGGRSTKRRKVDQSDEGSEAGLSDSHDGPVQDDDDDEDDEADNDGTPEDDPSSSKGKTKASKERRAAADDLPDITSGGNPLRKNLVVTESAIKKSGVVYMSRVPPFMKPVKLRSLLERFGRINRIFLAPEDPTSHARRVRSGGNKKRLYTEGWVEFVRKKDAKAVCELLNAQNIGGKKGNYYHDDIWNLLYLRGFKWHNLTEQISAENAERTSRMRAEISKSSKENKEFVRNIEKAKMLDGMEAKARAKKRKPEDQDGPAPASASEPVLAAADGGKSASGGAAGLTRSFKQIPLAKKGRDGDARPEHVTRILSKIF
ncbi:ESF2/ABP1 family protein [Geosmithia morbida]|uniref:18S rRNA factor 2 n=1 Tax=Geosmithia morbida TaxID=1094350 RepID=A0A9P5D9N5_9HYPO|nr:ESF2/ABP1 family protein [Geosmithia morbida]KAF4126709.1 ESF2/ABP1 family protein [Geosmithia morbida]